MENLADRIRRLREQKKLSQEALGKSVGVSHASVSKWESGQTANLKLPNIILLCKIFGISFEELISGSLPELRIANQSKNNINEPSVSEYMTDKERLVLKGFRDASDETRDTMLFLAKRAIDEKASHKKNAC